MKEIRQAKVVYVDSTDSYELSVWDPVDRCWNLVCSAQCRHAHGYPIGEAEYIHYTFMAKVVSLAKQGYWFV